MTYIKNFPQLATNPGRRDALNILEAGYEAINTEVVIKNKLKVLNKELFIEDKSFPLSQYENIYFIGVGKCALDAGRVIEEILKDYIKDGVVIDTVKGTLKKIRTYEGTHPWPSEQNVSATKEIVDLLNKATENDLVLMVISGGGSALLCSPYNTSYENLINITQSLTKKGADIYELNTVRKHLSEIKGGQLAKVAHPAETVSLLFSDVLGDDISVIASGPTVKDRTTVFDAEQVLKKYELLTKDDEFAFKTTPKEDKWFERVHNFLIVTNSDAIKAMKKEAEELGYEVVPGSNTVSGEARVVGENFAKTNLSPGQVKISGGETTVTIKGSGVGGRNQETALGSLAFLPEKTVFISASSDGRDNTDVAGAICDEKLRKKAEELRLDPKQFISDNDSYNFFAQVKGQIITGSTGSNVSDLYILLTYK